MLEAAFETTAEAELVDALRQDADHWIQRYSMRRLHELRTTASPSLVLVYGSPQYYPRFGFTSASEVGITADWVTQTPALQILVLDDKATIPTGEVKLPATYRL